MKRIVTCILVLHAASGCGAEPERPALRPESLPTMRSAPLSASHAELADSKRECVDPVFHCAPAFGGGSDCGCNVPQTGTSLPGFEEVDIVMRQILAFRDGGAAALAIRYQDRLVYKRGFGRTDGDWDDGAAPLTPPDSAIKIGSISKNVVAAVMRELVAEKLQANGWQWQWPTAGDLPLLVDFDENNAGCGPGGADCLLPEEIHALFDGRADVPWLFSDLDLCDRYTALRGDSRWQDVTVGDVLGHSAGLPGSAPGVDSIYAAIPAFRGYEERADYEAEDLSLQELHPGYVADLEATRAFLAGELGVPAGDLYFLNRYDALAGDDRNDEALKAVAGRCLALDPVGYTDSLPGPALATGYSNTLGAIIERIVTHLHPAGRFAAYGGFPSQHQGSALEEFLAAELDIATGVETAEGMFMFQGESNDDVSGWGLSEVHPRVWNADAGSFYAVDQYSLKRPFCVFDPSNGACTFDGWQDTASHRPPWDFRLEAGEIPAVEAWQRGWDINASAGGLAAEMPVLAHFADRFVVDWGLTKGRRIDGCGDACPEATAHNGSLGGGFAEVHRFATAQSYDFALPPRDAYGRLTNVISELQMQTVYGIEVPAGVTFAFAMNQSNDPACDAMNAANIEAEGVPGASATCAINLRLAGMLKYALSRVDWEAVDAALAAEPLQIQGMAMVDDGKASYLMADDAMVVREGSPAVHRDAPAGVRVALDFPASRNGAHIVGAAYDDDRRLWTFFDDGRVSVTAEPLVDFDIGGLAGEEPAAAPSPLVPLALGTLGGPVEYAIAPDRRVRDILDVAMTQGREDLVAIAYYRDGTYSRGNPINLALHGTGNWTPATGQLREDVVGVAMIGGDDDHVIVRYRDGSVSHGTLADLDALGYWRGKIEDITIGPDGDAGLVYRSGFVRWLDGSLAKNWPLDKLAVTIGWDWLTRSPDAAPDAALLGVGMTDGETWVLTGDGTFTRRATAKPYQHPFAHGAAATVFQPGFTNKVQDWKDLVGLAGSTQLTYSWWQDGTVTSGNGSIMDVGLYQSYTLPPGQTLGSIVGMARDQTASGMVWTLYADGSVSAGTPTDLDRSLYLKAGLVLLAP